MNNKNNLYALIVVYCTHKSQMEMVMGFYWVKAVSIASCMLDLF